MTKLVARIFMNAKCTHFYKYFFYAVTRVNLIIFGLKIGRYIRICVTLPIQNRRYEITSDRCARHCTRMWRQMHASIFELYAYTYILHGNGNACAMPCDCSAYEISELNADTPPSPSRLRKINLFCHTFLSYEISVFAEDLYSDTRIIGWFCHTNWDPVRDYVRERVLW